MSKQRGKILLAVFFGAVLALSCANRRGTSSTTSEAQKSESRIDYAFGPMAPDNTNVTATKLIPFRVVSARGEITVLSGMSERRPGDSVFKLQYADGSQLWLVQER